MVFNWFKALTKADEIVYLMNDPGTPALRKNVLMSSMPSPPIQVKDLGVGYEFNTKQGRAAQVYVVISETLKWVQHHAPHNLSNWASRQTLIVEPEAGQDLNAYYYRKGMKFFYSGNVYTAASSDIVAHELGHAIFDSYRPDTWSVASLELWSFHEAFADITGILTALQNDEIIEVLLKNKYLEKDNLVSRVGEQIGKAIYDITEGKDGRSPLYLRNAAIKFEYVDPSKLPKKDRNDKIAAESHSFGRIMLGALYSFLYDTYEYYVLRGLTQYDALVVARNLLSKYLLKAITIVAKTPRFYQSFARAMMHAAIQGNKEHHAILRRVFLEWKIIGEIEVQDVVVDGTEIIKLSEEMEIGILAHNPLYDVEVEIPTDNRELGVWDAKRCLDFLHQNNAVSSDESTPFEIQNNKLVRTHI